MTPPTNTYTITISDGTHQIVQAGIPGAGGNTMAGKADALLSALQQLQNTIAAQTTAASFTQTATLTVTVTQP